MKLICIAGMALLSACNFSPPAPPKQVTVVTPPSSKSLPDYKQTLEQVDSIRNQLARDYKKGSISQAELEAGFNDIMTASIFPHWYGTAWDFNGTTQTPQQGAIACGYFITTTLEDAGVPLQRIKLAQSASQKIIENLIRDNPKKTFSNVPMDTFLSHVKKLGSGLYIVGLDFHVVFIHNDGQEIYFIHAKWANPRAVVKELAVESEILAASKYKIIGKLSSDRQFLQRWIHN